MKIIISILIFVQFLCAEDLFTLEESRIIDKHVKAAVNKRFSHQFLKQIEQQAASKYPLFKVGDKFTANNGSKHYKGTIHKIDANFVRVGSHKFSTKDYPKYFFDTAFNHKARAEYIDKNFALAKAAYQKRGEVHYKQKIIEKRPPSKRPMIVQQPIVQPLTAFENFKQNVTGYWHYQKNFKIVDPLNRCTRITINSIDLGKYQDGKFIPSVTAKILSINYAEANIDGIDLYTVKVNTELGGIKVWIFSNKGEFLTTNYQDGLGNYDYFKRSFVLRNY